jgi:hypothetical protein
VPQDGTTLALGLGELIRIFTEPESPKRRQLRNCGDGLNQLPVSQRERLLRVSASAPSAAKGGATQSSAELQVAAAAAQRAEVAAHRVELRAVQRSRNKELENATNWQPMCTSLQKAQMRAQSLAAALQKIGSRARIAKVISPARSPAKKQGGASVSTSTRRKTPMKRRTAMRVCMRKAPVRKGATT